MHESTRSLIPNDRRYFIFRIEAICSRTRLSSTRSRAPLRQTTSSPVLLCVPWPPSSFSLSSGSYLLSATVRCTLR